MCALIVANIAVWIFVYNFPIICTDGVGEVPNLDLHVLVCYRLVGGPVKSKFVYRVAVAAIYATHDTSVF